MEYVFFLDHDDTWPDTDKIRNQLQVLTKGKIWILWTQFKVIDHVGSVIWSSRNPRTHDEMTERSMLSCPILMSSAWVNIELFRTLGLLNEQYNGSDDWEFFIRALRKHQWGNLDDSSTQYRCFGWNTSQAQWHHLVRQHIKILQEHWKWHNGYHRALMIEYMKFLIPAKYRPFFRDMKQWILPKYASIIIQNWVRASS